MEGKSHANFPFSTAVADLANQSLINSEYRFHIDFAHVLPLSLCYFAFFDQSMFVPGTCPHRSEKKHTKLCMPSRLRFAGCFGISQGGFVWNNQFFFMLVALKSQEMPNNTNTWSYQTATIMQSGKCPTTQQTEPKDDASCKSPTATCHPSKKTWQENGSVRRFWTCVVFLLYRYDWNTINRLICLFETDPKQWMPLFISLQKDIVLQSHENGIKFSKWHLVICTESIKGILH